MTMAPSPRLSLARFPTPFTIMRPTKLLLAASLLAFVACTKESTPAAGGASTGGTFIIAGVGEPIDLFPPFVGDANGAVVQSLVFDKLAEIGNDLNTIGDKGFTPRLAKSWTFAPDSMSIVFSLDPRAKWHDGKPVTARDIVYSFKLYTDPKVGSPVAPTLANVDSVTARDSLTVVAWFKKHTPSEFYDVAYQLIPVPEHVYGAVSFDRLKTSDITRTLVGSGPFRFVKWEPKVRVELIADTSNYRGRPNFDRVILTPVSDPSAGATMVLTGQADYLQAFPIDQASKLDSSKVVRAVSAPTEGYTFLGFNPYVPKSHTTPHPIFSDIRVRKALAMGIDRVAMLHNVFGNLGVLARGPFPMSVSFADSTIKLPPYDTTAAKALLDSAGWKVGPNGMRAKNGQPLKFRLITPTTSLTRQQYSVLIQEAFRKLGVQMDIEQMDNAAFNARTDAGDFDATFASFNTDPNVSGEKQTWATSGIGANGQNKLRYSNKMVDALLDTAAASFDPVKARSASSRAFQQIADDVPAIFIYDVVLLNAVNRRVNVGPMRADGWWQTLSTWSIDPSKRIDRDRIGLGSAQP